ncbi:MFS transporter [Mucilaginibacter gotjawali]|uniref:Tetracycline resistance protein, class C n=2 Tax=Mucilaginibacter gotjawali TaxID=1550579 RepID=A0A110B113_9SPHI|nr:MFS transporter [Mucilaginibacter gotjawali]MBB3056580.1 DHA1 family tetracycline resistance protein-like MFS transporter [Mucilaginibacter gotjawali]BAU52716.1 Tetracycline resistance protein, class C [Mucilaginibacter gotjawali]
MIAKTESKDFKQNSHANLKSKNNRLWIIIGIVSLNSIGLSVVLPLLPFIVGKYLPVQQVVFGMSALLSVFAACTFFAAPIFGALSDRYGRKIILIISLLGSVIGYILFGIGGALWILFLGRIIDGLTAGNISTLFAYISDSTEPEERTRWFGYVGSVMGIGKLGGPALGGLLGSIALALPFYVTAALIFISGLAVYFLLPESLAPEKRTKHLTLHSFNTFSHFKDIFSLKEVKLLLILGVLFYTGLGIFQFNFIVFLKDIYKWGPAIIGGMLTIVGICDIITRALLLPWLLKHFNERSIRIAGLLGLGIGLGLILASIFIHSVIVVALAIIFIISGEGLFDPAYNGKLSQLVDESKQGKLQGVSQSLQAANNMLIPLVAAAIYFYSPAILYASATFLILVAVIMCTKFSPKANPALKPME